MRDPPPIPRLLDRPWFDRRLFTIHGPNPADPYLRRWTLLRTRFGKLCLHQFCRPDADACSLHDHPAAFLALVLAGGYRETMPGGVRWRPPGRGGCPRGRRRDRSSTPVRATPSDTVSPRHS